MRMKRGKEKMETTSKLLYVCSPYRGDTKRNKQYARELTRLAIDNGFCPVTVHLYLTEVLNDEIEEERKTGLEAGIEILDSCKYILVGGRYGISEGMDREIRRAIEKGKIMLRQDGQDIKLIQSLAKIAEEAGTELWVDPVPMMMPGA